MVDVSVIVPSYEAAGTIERCLTALRDQQTGADYEVIVVDTGTDETARIVASRFPGVRVCRPAGRRFPGGARNVGVAEARGAILAFTDADCEVSPAWVEAVRCAHRGPSAVVGGVVANANPGSLVGRAYYYTEFHRWLPARRTDAVDEIPACCLSMKRSAYERYGPFLEDTYCSDTVFHWRMASDGERPLLDPAMLVAHRNPTRLRRCLEHEASHGRAFARVRVAVRRMPRSVALLRAATSPLLPPLLFARAARSASASRADRRGFLSAGPLVLLAMSAWSYGELRGYLDALRGG